MIKYKMYNYIKGTVESYGPNYISLDNNGVGFLIYVLYVDMYF